MTTIQSDQVANYFRSFHGFQYESDESVPRVFAVNGSFDKIDIILHIILRFARGGKNVPPAVEEMLQSGGVDGSGGTPRVLEVVTNTGVWAQEMVDIYPSVRIVSVDTKPLVPHKPHARIDYEVYDLSSGIMEPESSFDLVYSKHAERATKDINYLLQELHRVLKPNGYLLIDMHPPGLYEGDPAVPLHSAPRYAEGVRLFRKVWVKQGLDVSVWDDLGSRLDAAHPHWENYDSHRSDSPSGSAHPIRGFHSIDCQTELLPLGMWSTSEEGKILGGLTQLLRQVIWRNFLPTMLVSEIEEAEAEAEACIEGIMQELADIDRYKAYSKCQFWCARKIEHV